MPTIEELSAARLKALQAGDRAAAAAIDNALQAARRGPPEPSWGEAASGMAQALPGAIGGAAMSGLGSILGAITDPKGAAQGAEGALSGLGDLIAGGLINAGVPAQGESDRRSADLASRVFQEQVGNWSTSKAIKKRMMEEPLGPIADIATVLSLGTGAVGKGLKLGGAASAAKRASDVAHRLNPVRYATKPIASAFQKVEQSQAMREAAKVAGMRPRALTNIADAMGDMPTARREAVRLGPDMSLYDASPGTRAQAAGIAETLMPDGDAQRALVNRAMEQAASIPERFGRNFETAVGASPLSKEGAKDLRRQQRDKATPFYERGNKAPVDVRDFDQYLLQVASENGNNKELVQAIGKIGDSLFDKFKADPQTGEFPRIETAAQLKVVREVIKDAIEARAEGKRDPGQDAFAVGSRDALVGRHLSQVYKAVNDELHKIEDIREGDRIYREAQERYEASRMGRRDTMLDSVEPENIEKRMSLIRAIEDPEHRASMEQAAKRGLVYRGAEELGARQHEGLTTGIAALGKVREGPTKRKIAAVAGQQAADKIAEMAGAEKTFAEGAKGITDASERGQEKRARAAIEEPDLAPIRLGQKVSQQIRRVINKKEFDPAAMLRNPKHAADLADMARAYARSGGGVATIMDLIEGAVRKKRSTRGLDAGLLALMAAMGVLPEEENQ